ncbi:hypothetical protein [Methyloceanibacter superfactus]|nr:hypothetical protein [Methyloceanibacter superfactus]
MIEKTQRNETAETPDEMSPGIAQSVPGEVQSAAEARTLASLARRQRPG